jgi:hypothetical protein
VVTVVASIVVHGLTTGLVASRYETTERSIGAGRVSWAVPWRNRR